MSKDLTVSSRASLIESIVDPLGQAQDGVIGLAIEGPPESGRTYILQKAMAELRRSSRTQTVHLSLSGGSPIITVPGVVDVAIELVQLGSEWGKKGAIALTMAGQPQAASAIKGTASASKFVADMVARKRQRDRTAVVQPNEVFNFILALPPHKRIVLLIDDIDDAELPGWWWRQLVAPACELFARRQGFLVVTAGSFGALGDDALGQISSSTHRLTCEVMQPLTSTELGELTGEDDPDLLNLLQYASGGQPGAALRIWHEMKRMKITAASLRAEGESEARARASQLRSGGLRRKLEMGAGRRSEMAEQILGAAALEGTTFTASAVAMALDMATDAVIDLLDDLEEAGGPTPVVKEAELCPVPGKEGLWRYNFADRADYLSASALLDPDETAVLSRRLVDALEDLYGSMAWVTAKPIARLLDRLGQHDEAASWYRWSQSSVSHNAAVFMLQTIVKSDTENPGLAAGAFDEATRLLDMYFDSLDPEDLIAYVAGLHRLAMVSAREDFLTLSELYLARAYRKNQEHEQALETLQRIEASAKPWRHIAMGVYFELGIAFVHTGQLDLADEYFAKCYQAARRVDTGTKSQASTWRARIAFEQVGEVDAEVQARITAAEGLARREGGAPLRDLLWLLVDVHRKSGQYDEAARVSDEIAESYAAEGMFYAAGPEMIKAANFYRSCSLVGPATEAVAAGKLVWDRLGRAFAFARESNDIGTESTAFLVAAEAHSDSGNSNESQLCCAVAMVLGNPSVAALHSYISKHRSELGEVEGKLEAARSLIRTGGYGSLLRAVEQ